MKLSTDDLLKAIAHDLRKSIEILTDTKGGPESLSDTALIATENDIIDARILELTSVINMIESEIMEEQAAPMRRTHNESTTPNQILRRS